MRKLYFLFEKIPNPQSGGLVTMYKRLEKLLSDTYDIRIISIFNCPDEYKKQFSSECIIINKVEIDNQFLKILEHIKKLDIKKIAICIFSMIKYFFYIPFTRKKLAKLINDEDSTIVSCPAAGIFMTSKKNFILEIHSKYDFFWEGSFTAKLQIKLMTHPNLIIFRNNIDALKGCKHFPSEYIYNFFDNKSIKINNDYKKRNNRFIFIARFSEEKDPIRLLNIFIDVVKKNKSIILDIYGQGSLEKEIREFIQKNNLDKNVFLKGFIDDKNIYANYSALLITSKSEGFPLTVIEAKANGIPTISTRWGEAVIETINNGVDGFIVENNEEFVNKVLLLANNEDMLRLLSRGAQKDFERFNVKNAKQKYINVIEKIHDL
ncbi:glycosyltransferase [[Clostridium] spiroforme]|nr:glycosyltransferase [Thomasclavelia spiroformis]